MVKITSRGTSSDAAGPKPESFILEKTQGSQSPPLKWNLAFLVHWLCLKAALLEGEWIIQCIEEKSGCNYQESKGKMRVQVCSNLLFCDFLSPLTETRNRGYKWERQDVW